ncbi:FbpB family small basic protein [Virgibacillus alimentarius]|uniref:FbpB family small basic protein n=1 Tax=Virgibacillus alimentarius TaxID=698769 RepID=UPI001CF74C75|nr:MULTISPECIES: FbpB family small basic protein [Virgibacillus]HLR66239.1 FbpB family small basic protein [Virgibacillus sp.]
MSLKKRFTFDELVNENKRQIMQDRSQIEEIEKSMEMRMHNSLKASSAPKKE